MNQFKNYFFQSFTIIVLSIVSFIVFKQFLPRKLFSETTKEIKNVVVDSLLLEAIEKEETQDEIEIIQPKKILYSQNEGVVFPPETYDTYKGYQYLIAFFEKLLLLETENRGKARIAYFGDSMTDGDMIVKDFRANFQDKFGGEGVGFVNITSESAASRSSVKHEFSGNWKTQSYLNIKNPKTPFGVNGHVFFTKDTIKSTWVKYKAGNGRYLASLNNPVLFYGRSKNKGGLVKVYTGGDTLIKKLQPVEKLNTMSLGIGDLKSFKAEFINTDSIPFYGFNFDNGKGVHVDNFSNRGNSGLPIATFDTGMMKAFHEKLRYDLIILHYGTNVLNYGSYNYSWYEKRMAKVVRHLKECFPGVSILVVSTADKATKYEMEMKTDSAVVPLIQAQKKYAVNSEAAFVNIFTLMGGDGSMTRWVEEVPASANKDYTHFNFRGAKKISDFIFNHINEGYEQFKKLKKQQTPAFKKVVKKDSVVIKKDTIYAE